MADKEEKKQKDLTPEEVGKRKAYWIGFLITFLISLGIATGSFFLIKNGLSDIPWEQAKWRILTDTFTLPAVLFIMSFLLVKVSDYGAFDAITYSVKLVFVVIFRSNVRKTKLPTNYREYRELRQSRPRKSVSFILYVGLIHLAVALIFMIIYFANK